MSLLALCLAAVLISTAADDSTDQTVQEIQFDNCPGYPNLPNKLDIIERTVDFENRTLYYFTGVVQLNEGIKPNSTRVKLMISKCLDPEDPKSCNKYLEHYDNDLCAKLTTKGKPWTPTVEKMQEVGFDPVCPTKPGNYSVKNALIDFNVFEQYNLRNGIYEYTLLFMNDDEPQMCVVATAELKTPRRYQKKKQKKQPRNAADAFLKRSLAKSGET